MARQAPLDKLSLPDRKLSLKTSHHRVSDEGLAQIGKMEVDQQPLVAAEVNQVPLVWNWQCMPLEFRKSPKPEDL